MDGGEGVPAASGGSEAAVLGSAELLAAVLAHVPQRERLDVCARVSKAWAEAAAAATSSVSLQLAPAPFAAAAPSLARFLAAHGRHVTALKLQCWGSSFAEDFETADTIPVHLPVAQLRQLRSLDLSGAPLHLHAAGGLAGLSHLTHLHVFEAVVHLDTLRSVSALTQLRVLDLRFVDIVGGGSGSLGAALSSMLPRLAQLQQLRLRPWGLTTTHDERDSLDLRCLAALRQLQDLAIDWQGTVPGACLPCGLTRLHLGGAASAALCDAGSLSTLTGLQTLSAQSGRAPAAAQGLAAALLAALPQLTQLDNLLIEGWLHAPAASPASYSALTASSHLTRLWLEHFTAPPEAVAHIFSASCALPTLHSLHFHSCFRVGADASQPLLGPAEVQQLVSACSRWGTSLRSLTLLDACAGTASELACLTQLSGVTSLEVGGAAVDDAFVRRVVLGLPGLEELRIGASPAFTERGLVSLTALSGLSELCVVEDTGLSNQTWQAAELVTGQPPDEMDLTLLDEELLELCQESRPCRELLLADRDARVQQLEEQLAASEQHLAQLQAQLCERDQQLAAAAAREAQLQRQLDEALAGRGSSGRGRGGGP